MIIGDIGSLIELDTGEDISSGSGAKIKYKKPSGDTGEWSATIDDTKLTYTTADGDLDEAGTWLIQGYLTVGIWTGHTAATEIHVGTVIE